jgi:hypothetical protein
MATKNPRHLSVALPITFPNATPSPPGNATHVELTTFYQEGGLNFYDYQTEPRGIYMSVRPVTVSRELHFTVTQYTMGDPRAFKVFITPATRFNAKTLREQHTRFLAVADAVLAALAVGQSPRALVARLQEAIAA